MSLNQSAPVLWAVVEALPHPLQDCARNELKALIAERDAAVEASRELEACVREALGANRPPIRRASPGVTPPR